VGGTDHQLLRSNSQSSTVTQILKKYWVIKNKVNYQVQYV
jgi:hypothetical protein